MILGLSGIDVDCIIGDRADERERAQRLTVDLRIEIDDCAADSDELRDTVDYAELTARVRTALVAAKRRMIERAAKVVCDICLADAKVRAATVCITKSGSVAHLAAASATYSARAS